jgi:hypothetical protein
MKKKGAALIITLVFISVLLVVGGAVAQNVTSTSATNIRMENLDYLRLTAETGIEKGYAYLKKNHATFPVSVYMEPYNMPDFYIEGSKYKCNVTIYNNDTEDTSNYGMYTIVSTATSGSSAKTITANVIKASTTSVTTTPFGASFEKFYTKLNANSAAIVNPVVSNAGQKDVFSNSGNMEIYFYGNTFFQGKINKNTFKPSKSITVIKAPEVVTYPTTVETIQMPTFITDTLSPNFVPQRDVIIKQEPADSTKVVIQYTTGNDVNLVKKATFDGYTVVLVNGNLTIEGSVTLKNLIIYCTGTTDNLGAITMKSSSASPNAIIRFEKSTFSGKTLNMGKNIKLYFDSAPNINNSTTNASIKDFIYKHLSDTSAGTTVVTTLSNPGSMINYRE